MCGLGHIGFRIVELLERLGERVVVITTNAREEWRRSAEEAGFRVILGDARDETRLLDAGLMNAAAVLAVTDDDVANIEIALDARRLRPDLPVVIRLFDQALARGLEESFAIRRAESVSAVSAPAFAGAALGEAILGSFRHEDRLLLIQEVFVSSGSPIHGAMAGELSDLGPRLGLALAAVRRASGDEDGGPLSLGDRVVLVGTKDALERLHPQPRPGRVGTGETLSPLRVVRRVWSSTSLALRSILLTLLALVLLSVVVFSLGMHLSPLDALYFVLSTVTTVGYGDITPLKASPLLKLYGCFVMLLGSATLATLTSIVSGFVVTERFERLLGRGRVPQSGHVIVAGLGNVGSRTAAELQRAGIEVAGVDRERGVGAVSTARPDVPFVLGDARAASVLVQAGVDRARAVVAVTGDDAMNLGIGLLAKKLNPEARVVVRVFDADFAEKVQRALSIDVALGSSRLAAPLFVASALQPDVRAAFLFDGVLHSIVERAVATWNAVTPEERSARGLRVLGAGKDRVLLVAARGPRAR